MPPRFVSVICTHGRSIPVSIAGVMRRLKPGDPAVSIPYQVYIRYAHKLELVGDSLKSMNQEMQTATTAIQEKDLAGIEKEAPLEPGPLPTWPMRVGPEEYLALYEKRANPSKTMIARLQLAKQIIAAKEAHDG